MFCKGFRVPKTDVLQGVARCCFRVRCARVNVGLKRDLGWKCRGAVTGAGRGDSPARRVGVAFPAKNYHAQ
jgi:hypothetical protein